MLTHFSPGIQQLLLELNDLEKPVILDLGATCTDMLRYLSGRRCKLYFEDLPAALFQNHDNNKANDLETTVDENLLDYGNTRFDLVLSWDLFNYLDLPTISTLMAKINRHCRPDTLFHMIRYTGVEVPCRPRRFTLADGGQLYFDQGQVQRRKVATHSTMQILKHMTDQFMESTLINEPGMQNGFVEHVLRYKPTQHQHRISNITCVSRSSQQQPRQVPLGNKKCQLEQGLLSPRDLRRKQDEYHSPGLTQIYLDLKQREDPKILILSAKQGRHFDFLLGLSQNIYVEDVFSALRWKKNQRGGADYLLSRDSIYYPPEIKFDAVLVWDLFNYCQAEEIEALGHLITEHCISTTLMYFFSYTHAEIPLTPRQFSLTQQGRVTIAGDAKVAHRQHSLTAAGLMKLLPSFYVRKTWFNQHNMVPGICEYLFEYKEQFFELPGIVTSDKFKSSINY